MSDLYYWLYVTSLPAGAILTAGLAVYAWRRRPAPGATGFTWAMLILASWSLIAFRQQFTSTYQELYVWQKIGYIVVVFVPMAWMVLALQYTGRDKWVALPYLAAMAAVPVVTLIVIWTDDPYQLFWSDITYTPHHLTWDMVTTPGAWFWISTAYSYALILLGTALIVLGAIRSFQLYRQQAIWMIVGALLPTGLNMLYTFHLVTVPGDPTLTGLTLCGVAMWMGLFHYRLFDVVPVARDVLIESMSDAMIVLDAQDRIVDINPAAMALVGVPSSRAIGQPAERVLSPWQGLVDRFGNVPQTQAEITLPADGDLHHYDLRISPLTGGRAELTGRLIVLHDITALKRAEQELQQRNRELEEARAAEQAALHREMDLARNIQISLLPHAAPHIPSMDVTCVCIPAREVGGDLFAYYELPATKQNPCGGYAFAVGDVSGKGIPAALYMAVSTIMLAAKAPFVPDTAQLLGEMNAALHPYMSPTQMNAALCYVRLQPGEDHRYTAHIANAGLIAPILRRGDRCEYLDLGGLPLGVIQPTDWPFHSLELPLLPGDVLILSSDGIVEAMDEARQLYGFERLMARVKNAPTGSAQGIQDWILSDMRQFAGTAEQHDDVTLIVMVVGE